MEVCSDQQLKVTPVDIAGGEVYFPCAPQTFPPRCPGENTMIRFARTILVRPLLGLTALALFAAAGCGGGDNSVTPPILTSPTRQASTLELAVTLPKSTFARGEAIPYTMTVKNVGTQAATLVYSFNIGLYSRVKQGGTLISDAPILLPVPSSTLEIAAGQAITLTGNWNQTSTITQASVAAGTYTLQGCLAPISLNNVASEDLPSEAKPLYTNPVSFTIHP